MVEIFKRWQRCALVGMFSLTLIAFSGCGDDDGSLIGPDPQPQTEPTPAGSPRPSVTPQPSPTRSPRSPVALWSRIHLREDRAPVYCLESDRLTVQRDGDYVVSGPCLRQPGNRPYRRTFTGRLTIGERAELRRLGDLVVLGNLNEPRRCTPGEFQEFFSLRIQTSRGSRTVHEQNIQRGNCYRGNRADVDALWSYMQALQERYYPGIPAPAPSPSPSPSHSPSPSPSPTESMTVDSESF